MKKLFICIIAIICLKINANAQGCVAVRQMGGVHTLCAGGNSYNLQKGDMQVGLSFRKFHSWRHFVGTEEQKQRQNTGGGIGADGIDHGNAVNIYSNALDFNFSYGLSNRVQLNFTLPWVSNERSQVLRQSAPVKDTFRYSVFARGFGDIRLSANYWVLNPETHPNGNVMVGVGVKLNNGKYNATDVAPQSNGTKRIAVMDQAIQPGDGGIGFTLEAQAFKKLSGRIFGFANGYYLFSPRESNGTFKSKADSGLAGYNIYACPDQYFARAGAMVVVGKQKNVDLSLAYRAEGIPAYDAFGGQVAYRRPGYVMAVETGVTYRSGKHTFSLFVPYNFKKNRIQSAADIAKQNMENNKVTDPSQKIHVQGDAAFADYSINLGYSFRISRK